MFSSFLLKTDIKIRFGKKTQTQNLYINMSSKELLKEILDIDLEVVKIDLNEFPRAYVNGKRKVLDILVSADNLTADVEININPNKSTYMRNYVYLSTIIRLPSSPTWRFLVIPMICSSISRWNCSAA